MFYLIPLANFMHFNNAKAEQFPTPLTTLSSPFIILFLMLVATILSLNLRLPLLPLRLKAVTIPKRFRSTVAVPLIPLLQSLPAPDQQALSKAPFLDAWFIKEVPSLQHLVLIADSLHTSVDYLLGRTDDFNKPTDEAREVISYYNQLTKLDKHWVVGQMIDLIKKYENEAKQLYPPVAAEGLKKASGKEYPSSGTEGGKGRKIMKKYFFVFLTSHNSSLHK